MPLVVDVSEPELVSLLGCSILYRFAFRVSGADPRPTEHRLKVAETWELFVEEQMDQQRYRPTDRARLRTSSLENVLGVIDRHRSVALVTGALSLCDATASSWGFNLSLRQ